MDIPAPPDGWAIATSPDEVERVAPRERGRGQYLRLYVDGQWLPGRLDITIRTRRPSSRNVAVVWGPRFTGWARRLPIERIAIADPNGT